MFICPILFLFLEDDIGIKTSELSTCNETIKALLDHWNTKLEAVLEATTQFNKDYERFSRWIIGTQIKLNALEDVVASVDGVKKQMMETEVYVYLHYFI